MAFNVATARGIGQGAASLRAVLEFAAGRIHGACSSLCRTSLCALLGQQSPSGSGWRGARTDQGPGQSLIKSGPGAATSGSIANRTLRAAMHLVCAAVGILKRAAAVAAIGGGAAGGGFSALRLVWANHVGEGGHDV